MRRLPILLAIVAALLAARIVSVRAAPTGDDDFRAGRSFRLWSFHGSECDASPAGALGPVSTPPRTAMGGGACPHDAWGAFPYETIAMFFAAPPDSEADRDGVSWTGRAAFPAAAWLSADSDQPVDPDAGTLFHAFRARMKSLPPAVRVALFAASVLCLSAWLRRDNRHDNDTIEKHVAGR